MAESKLISIRVPSDVLEWFKQRQGTGRGYQTMMKEVLARHVEAERLKGARVLGRAQEIFRRYHTRCFWHLDPELRITEENLPLVIEGLRKHGGREGFLLAAELCQ